MVAALLYRSLLTDTLPYEVPVIFSNNLLHASLSCPPDDAAASELLNHVRGMKGSFSVPYSFEIKKSDERTTTLGVIHPLWQIEIAHFYERHSSAMLDYCGNDKFTLRRPDALASPFIEPSSNDEDGRLKLGVAQLAADAGEPDITHMTSYFTYRKYNLLGKFVESREYRRLEARFRLQRRLDVAKCFYNIYTHSLTWAVKEKSFSKTNATLYSMEAEYDTLMQRCNYNETNGIVVGPEFSRIFAEIILQHIDNCLSRSLLSEGLVVTEDYDVRRYVDDYFIYANDLPTLNVIEKALRQHLEAFKLFANEQKVETSGRPFVTPLTLARRELAGSLSEIGRLLKEVKERPCDDGVWQVQRTIRHNLGDVRLIVKRYAIGFESISGWLFARLLRALRGIFRSVERAAAAEEREPLLNIATDLLEAAFQLAALDVRVRPTYSLCQCAMLFGEKKELFSPEQWDGVQHVIMDECLSLLRTASVRGMIGEECDSVEAFNLLICGAQFVGEDFVRNQLVQRILSQLVSRERISYFAYITAKFCLRKGGGRVRAAFGHPQRYRPAAFDERGS